MSSTQNMYNVDAIPSYILMKYIYDHCGPIKIMKIFDDWNKFDGFLTGIKSLIFH